MSILQCKEKRGKIKDYINSQRFSPIQFALFPFQFSSNLVFLPTYVVKKQEGGLKKKRGREQERQGEGKSMETIILFEFSSRAV